MAVRHLLDAGHRRIAFVGDREGNPFGFGSSQRRLEGMSEVLADAGLELPGERVRRGPHGRAAAHAMTAELLALASPPTAIFAASDVQALGVLDAAAEAGRRRARRAVGRRLRRRRARRRGRADHRAPAPARLRARGRAAAAQRAGRAGRAGRAAAGGPARASPNGRSSRRAENVSSGLTGRADCDRVGSGSNAAGGTGQFRLPARVGRVGGATSGGSGCACRTAAFGRGPGRGRPAAPLPRARRSRRPRGARRAPAPHRPAARAPLPPQRSPRGPRAGRGPRA